MQAQRKDYLDICKALGIFTAISIHVGFGDKWDYFTHVFVMQIFFFISGYLLPAELPGKYSAGSFILKKARTLLIPYFSFGAFFFLVQCVLSGFDMAKLYAFLFINTDNMPIVGALWFLTALFIAEVIYFLLAANISKPAYLHAAVFAVTLGGCFIPRVLPFTLPWAMGPGLVAVGFLHLGRLCRRAEKNALIKRLLALNWWQTLLALLLLLPLSFLNGYINIRRELYSDVALFWLNSVLSIFVLFSLSRFIDAALKPGRVRSALLSVGRSSLVYMILNEAVILFINTAASVLGLELPQFFFGSLVCFILVMLLLAPCVLVLEKTGLRVFLGKFNNEKTPV